MSDPRIAFEKHYTVTFRTGKYQVIENMNKLTGMQHYVVAQDGQPYLFSFTPNQAQHACLALQLVDAIIKGDHATRGNIIQAIERLAKEPKSSLLLPRDVAN